MDHRVPSGPHQLGAHLAEPPPGPGRVPGLVLCHGFPVRGREAPASGKSFPELADRIAAEMGWRVLTINFRGCGRSGGDFSMSGWVEDVAAAVAHLRERDVSGVWLAGTGTGGAVVLAAAARDAQVRGVVTLAAPADFDDWARHPRRLLQHARQVGVIRSDPFPPDFDRWVADFRDLTAVRSAAELGGRSLLVMHGDSDDLVPALDARLIADAHGSAELRIIGGAGHELRHDPRAVAILLGWLSRQRHGRTG